ncbi:ABC transporter substrate-binding protein [Phytoactinopolyspora mesophila]|uniref:ABC transporter substrate-binding protein n=1 Tax=Phytoactinopolyspora mesophila TaxID=2650750 RepID=A0A7K3MAG4_9ACTN|nr:ABC transporter substrate-binding protein [Phytoactinopolyspora mesophila]NDL60299.1 ABC transporter substrate-binding protein [Phytoactinopolyspora mesophila]
MAVSTYLSASTRRARRRSPASILSGVALSALLLTACGSDDDSADGSAPGTNGTEDAAEPADINDAAGESPSALENCGLSVAVQDPPERAVTMNQAATEVMLALGLQDRMAGTAYMDDEILPELAAAYGEIPVLADSYPSAERLLDAEPDIVYASYPSTFQPENGGERSELAQLGVTSYLSPSACPDRPGDEPLSIETVWQEIHDVGALFGAGQAAQELVEAQRADLEAALGAVGDVSDITVMWWDNGFDAPSVGVCCGAPGMIMDAAGVENAFPDESGSWAEVSWEQVVEREPDVIVLVDADWSTADDKRAAIESTPAVEALPAVQEERFVVIPFSATTPGIRNVSAVLDLVDGLEAIR